MTFKRWIVSALVRVYPASWRAEYGGEFEALLLGRRLTLGVGSNVIANGLWQRLRLAEPSTLLGVAAMLGTLAGLFWNLVDPASPRVLEEAGKTLPVIRVAFLRGEYYVLLLIACGYWTHHRSAGARSPGVAGMRMSFIAGLPVVIAGGLMVFGLLDPAYFVRDGSLTHLGRAPHSLDVLFSPLFTLPLSALWGTIGGSFDRWLSRRLHRA